MKKKTFQIAIRATMVALTIVTMYLASIMPTGRLGFLGLASIFGVAAVIESGLVGGAMVYAASCILGFLIVPSKEIVLMYAIFFGYYPLIKSIAEKKQKVFLGWGLKLLTMNTALTILVFAFEKIFFDISELDYTVPIVYAVSNVAFILYDIGVSGVIGFYMSRIHRKIK